MFFQGIFISILSFSIIIVCQPLISRAEFHFSHRIWPAFLGLGILLLLLSLWICYLWLSVIFCSAALTFLFGAFQLKRITICRRRNTPCRSRSSRDLSSHSCCRSPRRF